MRRLRLAAIALGEALATATPDALAANRSDTANVAYARYLGGVALERGLAIAADEAGNAYVAGETFSGAKSFAPTASFGPRKEGSSDVFLAKIDPQGAVVYLVVIGGEGNDGAFDVTVDQEGSAYLAGFTTSANFPVKSGPDASYNGGFSDAFVAKVNPGGTDLVYAGYLGGGGFEAIEGIAVDASGAAYLTGFTDSDQSTFPVKVGPDLTHNGVLDTFVAKLKPDGGGLEYCGYIGGSGDDAGIIPPELSGEKDPIVTGGQIAVDRLGNAYVAGTTTSNEKSFPDGRGLARLAIPGPDRTHNGDLDGFIAKVSTDGKSLVYAGYIGGSAADLAVGVAVDEGGTAYIVGSTRSTEATFPIVGGPDTSFNGEQDAFVAKLDPQGTKLLYIGYVGGPGAEGALNVAIDREKRACIAGYVESSEREFPVTGGPALAYKGGQHDGFVGCLRADPTDRVVRKNWEYLGYLGGAGFDDGIDIALDSQGNAYVAGDTDSSKGIVVGLRGASRAFGGERDAFILKVVPPFLRKNESRSGPNPTVRSGTREEN